MIQAVPEIILQLDHKGQVEWLNQPGIGFFGENTLGKDCRELFKTAISSVSIEDIIQNQNFGSSLSDAHFITEFPSHKDEFQKIIDWSSSPCLLQGSKKGILLVGRDITQQQYNEKRIKDSEKNYRDLFEKTPIGILKVDVSGEILDINQHMLEILGTTHKEEILHTNLANLFVPEQPFFNDDYKQLIKNQVISKDGEYTSRWEKKFWLQYKIFPIFDELGKDVYKRQLPFFGKIFDESLRWLVCSF